MIRTGKFECDASWKQFYLRYTKAILLLTVISNEGQLRFINVVLNWQYRKEQSEYINPKHVPVTFLLVKSQDFFQKYRSDKSLGFYRNRYLKYLLQFCSIQYIFYAVLFIYITFVLVLLLLSSHKNQTLINSLPALF